MKRDISVAGAALVAIATIAASIALTGCGADDSAPPATSSTTPTLSASSSPGMAANDAAQQSAPASLATPLPDASTAFAADSADAASDPVAQTMQANLAADNQQIAPVMRYAPGDGKSSN